MKENLTSINVIIDKSGSMAHLTNDTIGGVNQFLKEQKAFPGEALYTLCTFSSSHSLVHDCIPLKDVPDLSEATYKTSGGTALLDALGSTIASVGAKLAAMPEEERPSKVLFLVITDGEENSSREFTKGKIKSMVSHQTDVYKWEFVFMGANIDSFSESRSLGFAGGNTTNFAPTAAGTKQLYSTISSNTMSYRGGNMKSASFFDPNVAAPKIVDSTGSPVTPPTDNGTPGIGNK